MTEQPSTSDIDIDIELPESIYFFDGRDSCERCQAVTGFTFQVPKRPHPYCDCVILKYRLSDLSPEELETLTSPPAGSGADVLYAGLGMPKPTSAVPLPLTCSTVYRNLQPIVTITSWPVFRTRNLCGQDIGAYVSYSSGLNFTERGSQEVLDLMDSQNIWDPPAGSLSRQVKAQAGKRTTVKFDRKIYRVSLTAQAWEVCKTTDGAEHSSRLIRTLTATRSIVHDVEVSKTIRDCPQIGHR